MGAHTSGATIRKILVDRMGYNLVDNGRTTIAAVAGVDVTDPTATENPHLTDSANLFLEKGFRAGQIVNVENFTTGANNTAYFISKATAGALYFHNKGKNLGAEAAGDAIRLKVNTFLTDSSGNFSGYLVAQDADNISQGITPGSFALKFATGGSASFGLIQDSNILTSSGLTGGTTYSFGLQIDGHNYDIDFTPDTTDTSLQGVTDKIQIAVNTATKNGHYWKGATVKLVNGDIVIRSKTNIHYGGFTTKTVETASAELITQRTFPSGGISNIEICAPQAGTSVLGVGVFPTILPSPKPSFFTNDFIIDKERQKNKINEGIFVTDDGYGNLNSRLMGSGTIIYETGRIVLRGCKKNAEFAVTYDSTAALSGKIEYADTNANGIQRVFARSCNGKIKGKLRIIAVN